MRFKFFYQISKDYETESFDKVFEKYYEAGYFGDIDKEEIREHQKEWFNTLNRLIEERNGFELYESLSPLENKISREYFSEMTGINIKYETKESVLNIIKEFINKFKEDIHGF